MRERTETSRDQTVTIRLSPAIGLSRINRLFHVVPARLRDLAKIKTIVARNPAGPPPDAESLELVCSFVSTAYFAPFLLLCWRAKLPFSLRFVGI